MLQSRLIALFRGFTKDELKRFDTFLRSPYHNQSDNMIKLFGFIEPHKPLFDSKKLEKEKLFEAMYGKKKYNDLTMRKLISEMFKLAKDFIAHETLTKDTLGANFNRYLWLIDRGFEKPADAELEARRLLLDGYKEHDKYYYHHQRMYTLHKFERSAEQFRGTEHKLFRDTGVFSHIDSLNRDYLINSLSQHVYLLSLARIYNMPLNEPLLHQVETLALLYFNKGDVVIDIFFNMFQLLRTDDGKYFYQLKERFFTNDPSVPFDVISEVGVILENYCIKKIRDGEKEYGAEIMQVYKCEVELGLHLTMGKVTPVFYYNVAIKGAENNQIEWTEYFIEEHKEKLPAEHRDDSYNYARAHVLFARKKYEQALRLALSCRIPFFISKILIRNLVARIHYELDMLDELQLELDAYRHLLKDEKISDERRQFFTSFVATMRQLSEIKSNYSYDKLMQISGQVETQKSLVNRDWFLEKIKELEIAHSSPARKRAIKK